MNDLMRIPCVLMRGGTSKGTYFLTSDLPADPGSRDQVLLAVMGSGRSLEVDGIGGANPVTSKVAIVNPSKQPGADVHPSGCLDIPLEKHSDYIEPAAFVVRTARRLFEGYVLVKRLCSG